ncbi:hypothetical protein [Nostoc spongiaeforme]|nr:hypothetical protein [Nostoc spongiaeforme]
MSKARILDPSESYTFRKYAELAYDSSERSHLLVLLNFKASGK